MRIYFRLLKWVIILILLIGIKRLHVFRDRDQDLPSLVSVSGALYQWNGWTQNQIKQHIMLGLQLRHRSVSIRLPSSQCKQATCEITWVGGVSFYDCIVHCRLRSFIKRTESISEPISNHPIVVPSYLRLPKLNYLPTCTILFLISFQVYATFFKKVHNFPKNQL